MAKFKVAWHELYAFEAEVEADSLDEAIDKVKKDTSLYSEPKDGQYVDGTVEINTEFTNFLNSEEGKCQSSATH